MMSLTVRERHCTECEFRGLTVEAWVPQGETSMSRLDEHQRHRFMMGARRRNGYKGIPTRGPASTDTLAVSVKVIHNKA